MNLLGLIARDQVKIFGAAKEFGESISYRDEWGNEVDVWAFIEREMIEPRTGAGYRPPVGRACIHVWIPQTAPDGVVKVTRGVDRIKAYWRRGDADRTEFVVTTVLPDSDGAWHLECTK
jgi:hypothetical protein